MINSIENFSNEIFYEIFDYLDGCDIYKAFSNLNYHFSQLLNSSLLLYKIKFDFESDDLFMNNYQHMKSINPHQIFSLNLSSELYIDKFLSSFNIDSSLDHLQSIYLENIQPNTLLILLKNCIHLPYQCQIYLLIFTLPTLKYCKITSHGFKSSATLPFATDNQQLSMIEHLIIDHSVTFSELAAILSYTPKVYHLKFWHEDIKYPIIQMISSTELSKLTHISMNISYLEFDEFEIFLSKLASTLKSFNLVYTEKELEYLDFDIWEELILQNFPQLEKFYFDFNAYISDEDEFIFDGCICDQFISSFWINRQWFVEIVIEPDIISLTIKPYRKKWYEFINIDNDLNVNHLTLLTIRDIPMDKYIETYDKIEWLIDVATIYHLEICDDVFIGTIINIMNILSSLDSLKLSSIKLPNTTLLSMEELDEINHAVDNNKITKVYLDKMIRFDDVLFLIDLFPKVKYLQIGCTSDIDINLFLQIILMKIQNKVNSNLHLLAISIPTADDYMIERIQNMIDFKRLLFNYTIKRTNDTIFLRMKSF
ncbi:unnamed protein product [Adineta steineri]|uniref:F-box domain-containing protein n=1 Tax=Adineta steineri TaxID=433720 RepID=A0A819WK30_9BILA|nr:unnamed protein product [Adineta steineri]CAF4127341.1 unnamed protein product [Adineta steineri]